jgi:hypothetical protein
MKLKDFTPDPKIARLFKRLVMGATRIVSAPFKPINENPWNLQSDTGDETLAISHDRTDGYVYVTLRAPMNLKSKLIDWLKDLSELPGFQQLSSGTTKDDFAWWTVAVYPKE